MEFSEVVKDLNRRPKHSYCCEGWEIILEDRWQILPQGIGPDSDSDSDSDCEGFSYTARATFVSRNMKVCLTIKEPNGCNSKNISSTIPKALCGIRLWLSIVFLCCFRMVSIFLSFWLYLMGSQTKMGLCCDTTEPILRAGASQPDGQQASARQQTSSRPAAPSSSAKQASVHAALAENLPILVQISHSGQRPANWKASKHQRTHQNL